jgi:hypothetical protein
VLFESAKELAEPVPECVVDTKEGILKYFGVPLRPGHSFEDSCPRSIRVEDGLVRDLDLTLDLAFPGLDGRVTDVVEGLQPRIAVAVRRVLADRREPDFERDVVLKKLLVLGGD